MKGPRGNVLRPNNVFGGQSDSESDDNSLNLPPHLRRSDQKLLSQQIQEEQNQKEEGELAYQYDEVFDDMKAAEKLVRDQSMGSVGLSSKTSNQSVYMSNLLDAKRRRELDKLNLRATKTAKERELEGNQFKDKEVFETSSYKKFKDEAQKLQEEEEKRLGQNLSSTSGISSYKKTIMDQEEMRYQAMIAATEGKLDEFKKQQESRRTVSEKEQQKQTSTPVTETPKLHVLKGGLNLTKRPKPVPEPRRPSSTREFNSNQDIVEEEKKKENLLQLKLEKLLKSKVTEDYLLDARNRYLERQKLKKEEKSPLNPISLAKS